MGCGCLQEVDIFLRVVLAKSQFVNFLLAAHHVGITLEQAFLYIVVNRQTDRLDLHAALLISYALLL